MARESADAISLSDLVVRVLGPSATPSLAATGRDPAWESLLSRSSLPSGTSVPRWAEPRFQ
jgi:hypothetical protein